MFHKVRISYTNDDHSELFMDNQNYIGVKERFCMLTLKASHKVYCLVLLAVLCFFRHAYLSPNSIRMQCF